MLFFLTPQTKSETGVSIEPNSTEGNKRLKIQQLKGIRGTLVIFGF